MKIYLSIVFLSISTIIFGQKNDKRLSDNKVNEVACALCSDVIEAREEAYDIPKSQSDRTCSGRASADVLESVPASVGDGPCDPFVHPWPA